MASNVSTTRSVLSGFAGAIALTAVHETVRRFTADAPRMDTYGRRAIAKGMQAVGVNPPSQAKLQIIALIGDVLANGFYFALIGAGEKKRSILRGASLGALAGIGAVILGPMMQLGRAPARKTKQTVGMTILWYMIGGVASAIVYKILGASQDE